MSGKLAACELCGKAHRTAEAVGGESCRIEQEKRELKSGGYCSSSWNCSYLQTVGVKYIIPLRGPTAWRRRLPWIISWQNDLLRSLHLYSKDVATIINRAKELGVYETIYANDNLHPNFWIGRGKDIFVASIERPYQTESPIWGYTTTNSESEWIEGELRTILASAPESHFAAACTTVGMSGYLK